MTDMSYIKLPKPVEGDELLQQVLALKEIRLLSLKTNPDSFISRYEDEVDQPLQFAIDRTQEACATHFVAVTEPQVPEKIQYNAFLVMLKKEFDASKTVPEYEMAAIYVRPPYRGRGVCTRLIESAMHWVKEDCLQHESKGAIVHTTVREGNVQAARLYSKLGFEIVKHTTHKNKIGVDVPIIAMKHLIVLE